MDADWRLINWAEREAAQLNALRDIEAIGYREGHREAIEKVKPLVRKALHQAFDATKASAVMDEIFPSGVGPRGGTTLEQGTPMPANEGVVASMSDDEREVLDSDIAAVDGRRKPTWPKPDTTTPTEKKGGVS